MARPRPGPSAARNLTLTEELERLEQSITLTLQEIDHNFSKAHRIVTSSILPIVEQYAQHSQDVWEGSKFWKQFFEASANVSLSGYEENAHEEDQTHTETTASHDSTFQTPSAHDAEDDTITGADDRYENGEEEDDSVIDSPSNATGVHSTPRIAAKAKNRQPSPSPMKSSIRRPTFRTAESPGEVSTPQRPTADMAFSSPFEPPSAFQPATAQREQNPDPLMHRVLDRNFRIQATPHTARKQARGQPLATPGTGPPTSTRSYMPESSPMSSPEMAAPQLRSDLFSPGPSVASRHVAPRTPGISVQTPGRGVTTSTGRSLYNTNTNTKDITRTLWESDSDEELGLSPPKTMQFHIPQSRLMQTPAREASRIIVDDLLATAGADRTDEIEGDDVPDISPSVVRRKWDDDDTF
ncbi:hypothetical protein MBLNU459_g8017t1 [Dothideomycetes sp. NU459]